MSDYKTIIKKSMTQTDAAIASARELAVICDNLVDERNNLAAHNAMLRETLNLAYGALAYDHELSLSVIEAALNATQADVDAWRARNNHTPK